MKSKRLTAFVLAFLMIFTSFGTMAFADTEGGSDISGHWAEASIQKWVEAGVINGYSDGTFRPDNGITRAEFVKIVNGLLGFKVEGSASFTDVASGEWYAAEVKKAVREEFVSGYEDGSFRPDKGITRQEAGGKSPGRRPPKQWTWMFPCDVPALPSSCSSRYFRPWRRQYRFWGSSQIRLQSTSRHRHWSRTCHPTWLI